MAVEGVPAARRGIETGSQGTGWGRGTGGFRLLGSRAAYSEHFLEHRVVTVGSARIVNLSSCLGQALKRKILATKAWLFHVGEHFTSLSCELSVFIKIAKARRSPSTTEISKQVLRSNLFTREAHQHQRQGHRVLYPGSKPAVIWAPSHEGQLSAGSGHVLRHAGRSAQADFAALPPHGHICAACRTRRITSVSSVSA